MVVRIKHFCVFKVSTQSSIHKKYAANAKESHTIPSFPHLALEPFFPRGRQMLSQLELTHPLAGGLEFKPELEELTQDHQLP